MKVIWFVCTHHATGSRAGKRERAVGGRAPRSHGAVRQECNRDTPGKLERNRRRDPRKRQSAKLPETKNFKPRQATGPALTWAAGDCAPAGLWALRPRA